MPANPSPTPTFADFCATAGLGDEALSLLAEDQHPRDYVAALVEAEHFPDAVRLLAHALPLRQGIFWAWSCARRASGEEPPPPIARALAATERWLSQPVEANRRPLLELAQQADVGTPAGAAALAGFFSGGSIAPPGAQEVPPPPTAAAQAITGSVMLSAVVSEPEKAPEKFRAAITQALDVATRVQLWLPGAAPAR